MVVAVVTEDHEFAGVHHVSRLELVERVPELEGPSGWAMVFSQGTDHAHVAARTEEMISLADKRIEMISRIAGRRSNSGIAFAPQPAQSGSGPCGGIMPCWRSRRSRSSSP